MSTVCQNCTDKPYSGCNSSLRIGGKGEGKKRKEKKRKEGTKTDATERDMGQRTEANERMGVHNIRLFFSLAKGNLSFFPLFL
jgi:hypothetical protein